jgi:hypothetical protein
VHGTNTTEGGLMSEEEWVEFHTPVFSHSQPPAASLSLLERWQSWVEAAPWWEWKALMETAGPSP